MTPSTSRLRCFKCGYDVAGSLQPASGMVKCPECGTEGERASFVPRGWTLGKVARFSALCFFPGVLGSFWMARDSNGWGQIGELLVVAPPALIVWSIICGFVFMRTTHRLQGLHSSSWDARFAIAIGLGIGVAIVNWLAMALAVYLYPGSGC